MNTGHVKQVAAFEKLVECCSAQGAMYNPSNASITLTALRALLTSARQSLEAVKGLQTAYTNGVIIRQQLYDDMPKFITRVINAMAANGASQALLQDAYALARKYQSRSKDRGPLSSTEATATVPATRSTAQLDFDRKADHFDGLVKLVQSLPAYAPHESDLQLSALKAKLADLRNWNTRVMSRLVALANARLQRNQVLYASQGIHGIGLLTKRYVRGAFGYSNPVSKQVGSIRLFNKI